MSSRVSPSVPADLPALSPAPERRRSPRLQLLGEVHGQLVDMAVPIVVRNLSEGGFSIDTTLEFPDDAVHRFRLTPSGSDDALIVQARAVHSYMTVVDKLARFVTGFAFTPDQPNTTHSAIERFVDETRSIVDARAEAAPSDNPADRRTDARLDVLGELHGEIESLGVPFLVRDFSMGGCCIETHTPLEVDQAHTIRIDVYDCLSVLLRARVAHSRRGSESDRPTRYVTGLQFLDADREQLSEMLGMLTSSLRIK